MNRDEEPYGDKGEHLDLEDRREQFLETFFRKGAEFTNELLDEVGNLRARIDQLTEENAALRHQLASDDAIRELLVKIEELEREKSSLRGRAKNATEESLDYKERYSEVERELDAMANLYVASYQLHSTLRPAEVLSIIEQLLMQFVGAASFAIYLRTDTADAHVLQPAHTFECERVRGNEVRWGEGPIGEAAETQVHSVRDPNKVEDEGSPLACIPMVLAQETIGVIAVYDLLEQKTEFVEIDFELFRLLALHSASAIVGAGLLSSSDGVGCALDAFPRL
ncbi:MAG: GAF domain-containing protein [Polyangia bacterium]